MTDDSPDTFLGAFFQLIIGLAGMTFGLALMGGSLVLLVALLGAAFNIFSGNAPGILEPFGGALTGLLADLVKLLANVMMVFGAIVMIWLMVTGQMDEIMDDMFNEHQSSNSQQHEDKSNRTSTRSRAKRRRKSSGSGASVTDTDSTTTSNTTESFDDTEFDKYGQIREE